MPGSLSRFWAVVLTLAVMAAGCTSVVTVGRRVLPKPKPKPVPVSVLVFDTAGNAVSLADITIAGEPVGNGEEFGVLPEDFPLTVTVSADGYHPTSLSVAEPPQTPVRVRLAPVVFQGRIVTASGDALSDATVRLGDLGTTTGADGTFELLPAVAGTVSVERPAWMPVEVEWDGAETLLEITLEPRIVRATHAIMWLPGKDLWEPFLDLASRTEINAMVLDIKDESGLIAHRSEVPLALEVGAVAGSYALDE
ncbi:MAG: hypothetical protein GWP04_12495, partial [Gammaproteobacteria bacterium]|nr:hypothetical protein [Gammaproteobacteria bacterium]